MDEDLLLVLFFFILVLGFVLMMTKMRLDYKREARQDLAGPSSARSLGASELKRLLEEAVAEGVAPLEARIERMERSLRRLERAAPPALPPRHEQTLLDDTADLADAAPRSEASAERERLA